MLLPSPGGLTDWPGPFGIRDWACFASNLLFSCFGFFTVSSILKTVQAASVAALKALSLTTYGSQMKAS